MRKLVSIIVIISAVAIAFYLFVVKPSSTSAAWYDGAWGYRKSFTLSRASGVVTNYQMKILVGESSGSGTNDVNCDGHCKTDFSDLRFTNSTGTTLLDYWIESTSGTTPNQVANVWVEFDSIGTTATTFYIYYGNSGASAVSNGANAFLFFDDFNNLSNFGGAWGSPSCSNSILTIPSNSGVVGTINNWGTNTRIRAKGIMDVYNQYIQVLNLYKDGNNYTNICATDPVYFYYSQVPGNADSAWPGLNYETSNWHIYEIKRNASTDIRSSIDDANQGIMSTYPYTGTGSINMSAGAGGQMRYDWVFIAQWLVTEPAFGSWGSGESAPTSVSNFQKGLIGWWKFDGNANDSTPNSNNGTVNGAILATDRKSQVNKAYSFDGVNDNVDVGSHANLKTTNVSVSFWVKPSSNQPHSPSKLFTQVRWVSEADNSGYSMDLLNTGDIDFTIWNMGSYGVGLNSGDYLAFDVWHHIVGTYDGNVMKLYVDGVLKNSANYAGGMGNYDSASLFLLGGGGDIQSFLGIADDYRIYNRALSAAEVTALYDSYDPGIVISDIQKGLVGWWEMDGNATDSTPNGNNGIVTGATLTTDRKSQVNRAYNFDGSNNINVGNGASLNITGDVAIAFWVKTTLNNGTWIPTITKEDGCSSNNRGYAMYLYTGKMFLTTYNCGGLLGSFIADGNWHHVVGVLKSGMYYLYLDGKPDGSTASGGNPQIVANSLIIGDGFPGFIDDVRIYNRALSAAEVTALYDSYDPGIVISDIQKGLVGWWEMDGNATDSTPNGNNGVVTGAYLTTDREGQMNKAYSFDGNDDYIYMSDSASLKNTLSGFTVGVWVYPTNYTGHTSDQWYILSKLNYPDAGWWLYLHNGGAVSFATLDGSFHGASTAKTLPLNQWSYVVGWSNGITDKVFINGVEEGSGGSGTLTASTDLLRIGHSAVDYQFQGLMDDVRIYNRALSAAEVKTLYENY